MQDSGSPVLLEHLFRRESGRIVAWLSGLLGSANLQLAEDAAQEAMLRAAQGKIEDLLSNSLIVEYGFVDRDRLLQALRSEVVGDSKWIQPLTKSVCVELWLRSLQASGVTPHFYSNDTQSNQDMLVTPRAKSSA